MIIQSRFQPHPLLKNPHLQTLIASQLRRTAAVDHQQERLELPDGDFVDLAYNLKNDGPMVCVFHGLQGSMESSYARGVFQHLCKHDYQVLFMHFRGCSGEPNRLACSYHSGHTDDIRYLLDIVTSRFPAPNYYAVAYSLGANALLKYLGEAGCNTVLEQAVAISPPLVLAEGANRMNTGLSRIYQWHLVKKMKEALAAKKARYPQLQIPGDLNGQRTFWQFDNTFTAPLNGFRDVHDYYENASSRPWLRKISIPTSVIFAEDDPFFTQACIPTESELSVSVEFELSRHGGHVGFIGSDDLGRPAWWLDERITEIFSGHRAPV